MASFVLQVVAKHFNVLGVSDTSLFFSVNSEGLNYALWFIIKGTSIV